MKAMVLCAGFGTRLGDLTREIPKPMLSLGDRPMLEYILCHLKRQGFDEVAINLHFMPEAIQNHFADGARWGLRLTYSHEPQLLGTAGGTKKLAAFFANDEPFLMHYGDIVTNQDFTAMLGLHRRSKALATLLVHHRARSNSALSVDSEGRIERFLERPTDEQWKTVTKACVFSGIAICQPELLDSVPADTPCDFPRDIFVRLTDTRRLYAFELGGQRTAVDSPERLAEARRLVAEGVFRADLVA
jgi:NDP-sugar pyrophosphorylase family protein